MKKVHWFMKNKFLGKTVMSLFVAMTMALIAAPVYPGTWQVTVKNNCSNAIELDVYGEHLFWRQIDCQTGVVQAGGQTICYMPEWICPIKVALWYHRDGNANKYDMGETHCGVAGIACCWNLWVRTVNDGSKCKVTYE